jgi:hypothetical protein
MILRALLRPAVRRSSGNFCPRTSRVRTALFAFVGMLIVSSQGLAQMRTPDANLIQADPIAAALAAHGATAESVQRLQLTGVSRSARGTELITISASLDGSLRVDYGRPITRTYRNTAAGATEVVEGKPVSFKPPQVGAFAQLDMLAVFGIRHLAGSAVQRTVEGTGQAADRTFMKARAVTGRHKVVLGRDIADGARVQVDTQTGVVLEITRDLLAENSVALSIPAGFRFKDYRLVEGIYFPFQIERVLNNNVVETISLDAVDLHPAFDSDWFKTPHPPRPANLRRIQR